MNINYMIFTSDAIDFHAPVKLGHIVHLTGRATFTSTKSMEIEVVVHAKDYRSGISNFSLFNLAQKVKSYEPSGPLLPELIPVSVA